MRARAHRLARTAVAALGLLERLQDLLEIQRCVEALHRGDALAAVALLDANVDEGTRISAQLLVLLLLRTLFLWLVRLQSFI